MKIPQTILVSKDRQHLPLEIQVSSYPVKTVSKASQQDTSKYTAEDLLGLSWLLFEEEI